MVDRDRAATMRAETAERKSKPQVLRLAAELLFAPTQGAKKQGKLAQDDNLFLFRRHSRILNVDTA
jgi:hypothetical protein